MVPSFLFELWYEHFSAETVYDWLKHSMENLYWMYSLQDLWKHDRTAPFSVCLRQCYRRRKSRFSVLLFRRWCTRFLSLKSSSGPCKQDLGSETRCSYSFTFIIARSNEKLHLLRILIYFKKFGFSATFLYTITQTRHDIPCSILAVGGQSEQ